MLRAGLVTLLLLLAGCSTGDGSEEPRDLRVERISSDAPGQGPRQPRAVVATSAAALSGEVGANVPDSGGYSMAVRSARLEEGRVTVRLLLREPPRDAILTQALTYPYAVAVIRELDPGGKDFSFVDENGRELGWPVRRV